MDALFETANLAMLATPQLALDLLTPSLIDQKKTPNFSLVPLKLVNLSFYRSIFVKKVQIKINLKCEFKLLYQ